jgi:hypothetical protein
LERAAGLTRDDTTATKLDKLAALLGDGAEPGDLSLIAEIQTAFQGQNYGKSLFRVTESWFCPQKKIAFGKLVSIF